jgi:hypothetical protein
MFVFAVIAACCVGGRLPVRGVGYLAILLASLLKFYPAVLFVLLLRERWKIALAIGFATAILLVGFVVVYHDELVRMAINLPVTVPPGDGWGAKGLPRGVNDILPDLLAAVGYRAAWVDGLLETHLAAFVVLVALLLASLGTALHLAHRADMIVALDLLPPRAGRLLTTGAAAVCGCFFLGQSQQYRAIFLLLALPAFLVLMQSAPAPGLRSVFRWTAGATLFVLWHYPLRWMVPMLFGGTFDPPQGMVFLPAKGWIATYIAWAVMELSWWWVITVLMAILFRFLASLRPAARARIVPAPTSP